MACAESPPVSETRMQQLHKEYWFILDFSRQPRLRCTVFFKSSWGRILKRGGAGETLRCRCWIATWRSLLVSENALALGTLFPMKVAPHSAAFHFMSTLLRSIVSLYGYLLFWFIPHLDVAKKCKYCRVIRNNGLCYVIISACWIVGVVEFILKLL